MSLSIMWKFCQNTCFILYLYCVTWVAFLFCFFFYVIGIQISQILIYVRKLYLLIFVKLGGKKRYKITMLFYHLNPIVIYLGVHVFK